MIKRFISVLYCVLIVCSVNASVKDSIPAFIGYSYIPSLKWRVHPNEKIFPKFLRDKKYEREKFLKYDFDVNGMSSIEGNFAIRKLGLRWGLSANMENNLIGKAYKYGGYLGYRSWWLKIQNSKISGTATWTGQTTVNTPTSCEFSNKYFNVEIIKASNIYKHMGNGDPTNIILGTYWGIGYTSLGLPMEFETTVTDTDVSELEFGVSSYDTLFTAKYYTAFFGWDMLRQLCQTHGKYGIIPGKPAWRLGVYNTCADKIGFGSGRLSNHGVYMAEALNPGKEIEKNKGFSFLVDFSISLGLRYYLIVKPLFITAAVGYDFSAMIISGGPAAQDNKQLGYEYDPLVINRGVSFKLYVSWINNK